MTLEEAKRVAILDAYQRHGTLAGAARELACSIDTVRRFVRSRSPLEFAMYDDLQEEGKIDAGSSD